LKAVAVIFAIVLAWASGAAVDSSAQRNHTNTGAVVLLLISVVFGYLAWTL
jgi:hypothetical protein